MLGHGGSFNPQSLMARETGDDPPTPVGEVTPAEGPSESASSSQVRDDAGSASPKTVRAWMAWLSAMGSDAEAALAAALAYQALDAEGREAWLDSLDGDIHELKVPRIAVYAPLLAVESDPQRRGRIERAIGPQASAARPQFGPRALSGKTPQGQRLAVVVWPLYMEFVQVIACRFLPGQPFEWVEYDPILRGASAPVSGHTLQGARLEDGELSPIIDELALCVVAHQRAGHAVPEALRAFAHAFGATPVP